MMLYGYILAKYGNDKGHIMRQMMRNSAILACFMAWATPAIAQYTPGSFMYFDHVAHASWVNFGLNPGIENLKDDSEDDQPKPQIDPYLFTVSRVTRQTNIQKIVANAEKGNAAAGQAMKALLINQDIFGILDKSLQDQGLATNNLADALGFFWVTSWSIANDKVGQNSALQLLSVRDQASRFLDQQADIVSWNAAKKQEMSDTLYLNAVFLMLMYQQSKDAGAYKSVITQAAQKGALKFGVDTQKVTLTETGLELTR